MTWAEVHWKSTILEKDTAMQVLIPSLGQPPFPTLFLLHSLGDDSHAWMRKTRLERVAAAFPMLIVMPDGYRGFFTDNNEGPAYARYIGEEVVALVDRTFPVRRERETRAIGGASMGGYGALRVGLSYSDRFSSIHSNCGSLDRSVEFKLNPDARSPIIRQRPEHFIAEMRRIFGESPAGTAHDVLKQAVDAKMRGNLPKIAIDCGTEDYLVEANRDLHRRFDGAAIEHTYREYPGKHGWDYCDAHLAEALEFHAANLNIRASR